MIPLHVLSILPQFQQDMRHFALHNKNIITKPDDPERIMKQLNGHLEALQDPNAHEKLYASKPTQLNDTFLRPVVVDKFGESNVLKERYRPNLMGLNELRKIADMSYKYHMAMATKAERDLIDYYNHLEDEYWTRIFVASNIDEED